MRSPQTRARSGARAQLTDREIGVALCVVSATGWGVMPVLAVLAYAADVPLLTVLAMRFAIAVAIMWTALRRRERFAPDRRDLLTAVVLGSIAAAQALLFFLSVSRIGAALATLVLQVCPAIVVMTAWLMRREHVDGVRLGSLGLAIGGVALVVAGGGELGPLDALGVLSAAGAAVVCTGYILVSDALMQRGHSSLRLSAFVSIGAAGALLPAALAAGQLTLALTGTGWLLIGCLGIVSTAVPMLALFEGINRIGPGRASVIQTLEPTVAVVLAYAFLGERLTVAQTVGAILVLASVLLISRRAGAEAEIVTV